MTHIADRILVVVHNPELEHQLRPFLEKTFTRIDFVDHTDAAFENTLYTHLILLAKKITHPAEREEYAKALARKLLFFRTKSLTLYKAMMVIDWQHDMKLQSIYLSHAVDFYFGLDKFNEMDIEEFAPLFFRYAGTISGMIERINKYILTRSADKKIKIAGNKIVNDRLQGIFGIYQFHQNFMVSGKLSKEQFAIYDGIFKFYPEHIKPHITDGRVNLLPCETLNELCFEYFDDLFEFIDAVIFPVKQENNIEIVYVEYGDFRTVKDFRHQKEAVATGDAIWKALHILQ